MVDRIRGWDVLRLAAGYLGVWFVLNGILAFTVIGAGAQDDFPIRGNLAHGVLHLVTGLVALAVVLRGCDGAVRTLLAGIAVVYAAAALTGAISGDRALGFADVDTVGTLVHGLEAALCVALLVLAPRRTRGGAPAG